MKRCARSFGGDRRLPNGSSVGLIRWPQFLATPGEHRNLYGRKRGRRLRPSQLERVKTELPRLAIPGVSPRSNPRRAAVSLTEAFGRDHPIWLEIGTGYGEHLVRLAESRPDINFIGCEPYENGIAALLTMIGQGRLTNVRVHNGDVRELFDVIPPKSIDRVFLLYPDPWPKKRHHRRRFVTPEFLDPMVRSMRIGSEFRLATDIGDYARQALEQILPRTDLNWMAERCADWRLPWEGWQPTRYELKARREGRDPIYIRVRRI